MTTSYPDAIDDYNDPTKWNPQPTHDGTGEHSNAYSAIIAIEETIGTTGHFKFGGITEITSTGATVTITNPEGPITNLEASGGGTGIPGLSGSGDPINTNPTTPDYIGELYEDTSGATGFWCAVSTTSADWVQVGGSFNSGAGLAFNSNGAGVATAYLAGLGTGGGSGIVLTSSQDNNASQIILADDHVSIDVANVCLVNLYTYVGNPNGHVAAASSGSFCFDSATPGMWIATAADDAHWIQFGGILPTSASGLVTGSFWNNSGVVNVA